MVKVMNDALLTGMKTYILKSRIMIEFNLSNYMHFHNINIFLKDIDGGGYYE
jgi:hypothetical protein